MMVATRQVVQVKKFKVVEIVAWIWVNKKNKIIDQIGKGRTEKIYKLITVYVYTTMENGATIMFYRTYNIVIMLGHFLNQHDHIHS